MSFRECTDDPNVFRNHIYICTNNPNIFPKSVVLAIDRQEANANTEQIESLQATIYPAEE